MKLIQFGAGNIGRSFIGQLFARGGYEVVFIDVADALVDALNREHRYRVIVKRNDRPDETVWVEGVRALNAADREAVAAEIETADLLSTAVGKAALPHLFPTIAEGLRRRLQHEGAAPIEIIIAENIRSAAELVRAGLRDHLPAELPLDRMVGLVETSIGKMVPIMTDEDRATDPLWVFAEAYNTLIVDRHGFRGPVPAVEGIEPVDNITAYVDRKLFIHNLGHAATAYFGYEQNPAITYVWEALADRSTLQRVERAMHEAAAALNREYPGDLPLDELHEHIDDLLRRFANRSLGDTVFRVGRDLRRKLGREDRLIGACLLAARHGLPFPTIAAAVRAATGFRARDEHGLLFPDDRAFAADHEQAGLSELLHTVCGLDPASPLDRLVIEEISRG